MTVSHDIRIDFMDMTDEGRLWARSVDVRAGIKVAKGGHLIVGDDDADPRVGLVVGVSGGGLIDLKVLRGPVEDHQHLLD